MGDNAGRVAQIEAVYRWYKPAHARMQALAAQYNAPDEGDYQKAKAGNCPFK